MGAAKLVEGENWWDAVRKGKLAVVLAFIKLGGRDLDEKKGRGYNALFQAASEGHLACHRQVR